jgi:hypothetical protein
MPGDNSRLASPPQGPYLTEYEADGVAKVFSRCSMCHADARLMQMPQGWYVVCSVRPANHRGLRRY